MIEGVIVKKLKRHEDIPDTHQPNVAPGYLLEIVRNDEHLLKKFGQSTMTVAHQGAIKAFHLHRKQDDVWFVATGQARVVLHDLRTGSSTHGQTDVLTAGVDDYKAILIPAGVAHGYQVLSSQPVMLFYHTTEKYDAAEPDEERIAHDDPGINFNWSLND